MFVLGDEHAGERIEAGTCSSWRRPRGDAVAVLTGGAPIG